MVAIMRIIATITFSANAYFDWLLEFDSKAYYILSIK